LTDMGDDVAGSLDLSSVDTDDSALDPDNSDLDSSEMPNPDLDDSVQSAYGSSSGDGGGTSGTLIGYYTATYINYSQYSSYSPLTYREFTDSGSMNGTVESGEVTALTVTSVDGLFPGGLSSNTNLNGDFGFLTTDELLLEVYSSDGETIWQCTNYSSSSSGNVFSVVGSGDQEISSISGTCTLTSP